MTLQPTPHDPPDNDEDVTTLDELLDAGTAPGSGRHRTPRRRTAWFRLAERAIPQRAANRPTSP